MRLWCLPKNSLRNGFSFSMGGEAETDLLLLMFIRLWTPPLLVGRTVRSSLDSTTQWAMKGIRSHHVTPPVSHCGVTWRTWPCPAPGWGRRGRSPGSPTGTCGRTGRRKSGWTDGLGSPGPRQPRPARRWYRAQPRQSEKLAGSSWENSGEPLLVVITETVRVSSHYNSATEEIAGCYLHNKGFQFYCIICKSVLFTEIANCVVGPLYSLYMWPSYGPGHGSGTGD